MRNVRRLIDLLASPDKTSNDGPMQLIPLHDFEKSPLRFEFEALLTEYRSLRREILNRLTSQQQTINFAIALIAAVFAIRQLLPIFGDTGLNAEALRPIYILLSIAFSAFALMYAEHDYMMADIATYINRHLRPRMERILDKMPNTSPGIWEWDEFRDQAHYRSFMATSLYFVMSASRYAITTIPGFSLLLIYWLGRESGDDIPLWEVSLFVFAVVLALWTFITVIFMRRKYTGIL
jgi:hypothetical protein